MRTATLVSSLLFTCLCINSVYAQKKLIEYGWDVPNTTYVREHITEMEKVPFDGIVIKINSEKPKIYPREFGWCAFSKIRFNADDWMQAVKDLKATKFSRFKDNFLQLTIYPGDVDWFDPQWSNIAHNAGVLARLAKLSGCKGIMLDPEPYGTAIWHYKGFPEEWRKAHTFDEYKARVRECGKEFMRAINAEYPDITILTLYGPYAPLWMAGNEPPENCLYGLLRDFYDGALEVAAPKTIIVDGFESSYGFKTLKKFQKGKEAMLVLAKKLYSNPEAFDKHVRAGFGIWVDYCWKDSWSLTDFTKNYFTPDSLRQSLALALQESDGYVWVYTEDLRWWNERNAPQAYIDALALAKKGPEPEK